MYVWLLLDICYTLILIQTQGMIQVFDERAFREMLDRCFSGPLNIDPSWLCLLNLVFAIGLVLATPKAGSRDPILVGKLLSARPDRSEIFYLNAVS